MGETRVPPRQNNGLDPSRKVIRPAGSGVALSDRSEPARPALDQRQKRMFVTVENESSSL
jgi:hypothetical protein